MVGLAVATYSEDSSIALILAGIQQLYIFGNSRYRPSNAGKDWVPRDCPRNPYRLTPTFRYWQSQKVNWKWYQESNSW
jgi:hypothetical protein